MQHHVLLLVQFSEIIKARMSKQRHDMNLRNKYYILLTFQNLFVFDKNFLFQSIW